MKHNLAVLLLAAALSAAFFARSEDDPAALRAEGFVALRNSENDPDAVVMAALKFSAAQAIFEERKDETRAVEMNSCLYWCKKKMTSKNMDDFLRVTNGTPAAAKLSGIASAVPAADAKGYYERAEKFAADNPNDHMAVAIRYFEVADRFVGTDVSLDAQRKSLEAQQRAVKAAPGKGAAKISASASAPAAAPKDLLAIPPPAAQKESEKVIRDLYKDEYAKTSLADKAAFSRKLAQQANETRDDATARFVLWRDAVNFAAQGGDFDGALSIIDAIGGAYKIEALAMQQSALKTAAAAARDPELSRLSGIFTQLAEKPADPAANMAAGKYFCFTRRDWQRGLPYLARGADAALKAAAEADLAGAAEAQERCALGDQWWDIAEKQTDKKAKAALQGRAKEWYEKGVPGLSGLAKAKVENKLALAASEANAEIQAAAQNKTLLPARADAVSIVLAVDPKNRSTELPNPLKAGVIYEILAAGIWTGTDAKSCGPEGNFTESQVNDPDKPLVLGPHDKLPYLGQNPRNGLIAQIAGEKWTFYVGRSAKILAPKSGKLIFKMNDDESETQNRRGAVQIQVRELTNFSWLPTDGIHRISARVDAKDYLHITPAGVQWQYGGSWSRVGTHDGTYPTLVNGVYWWPAWTKDFTDTLKAGALFPPPGKQIHLKSQTGKVTITEKSEKLTKLQIEDGHGNGSHIVSLTFTIDK